MKDALKLFRRFLPPYKKLIGLNILFNLLGTIFGLFSFITVIPLLEILFGTKSGTYQMQEIHFSFSNLGGLREALVNNLYASVQQLSTIHGTFKTLVFIGLFFILMVLFKTGFHYLASLTMVFIRNHVVRDIRNLMYRKVVDLPIGFFTEERKGDIISRITGDVTEIENSVMTSLDMFFKNPIIIIITVVAMIFMSWQLTIFVFILFPIAGSLIGIIGKKLRQASLRRITNYKSFQCRRQNAPGTAKAKRRLPENTKQGYGKAPTCKPSERIPGNYDNCRCYGLRR